MKNDTGLPWLDEAFALYGQKEIKGPKHNSKILAMWDAIHASWFTDDETAWCAAYIGYCLEKGGFKSTRSARALSYLNYAVELPAPAVGCIAVKKRKGGGHVTFVVGRTKSGKLLCLGGNQNDAVTIAEYDVDDFETFRWPSIWPAEHRFKLPVLSVSGKPVLSEA
jgi:uncharacterized protein (TIGR02594 family)